jgi:hypothetical protein
MEREEKNKEKQLNKLMEDMNVSKGSEVTLNKSSQGKGKCQYFSHFRY